MQNAESSRQEPGGRKREAQSRTQAPAFALRLLLSSFCLLSTVYCLLSSPLAEAECIQKRGQAELLLDAERVEAGQVEMRLSGKLRLTFRVEGQSTLEVEPIQAPTPSRDWEVRQGEEPQRLALADGRVRWQQSFRLDAARAGELPLPLTPLRFREQSGASWEQVAWQPLSVRVTTEIVQPDLSELRDIPPPEELPPVPPWWLPFYRAGLALVLLGLLAGSWQLLRRRTRRERAVPPDQWALAELDRAGAGPLETEDDVEQFFIRVSDVLRTYLELRFQLPAPEQTTAEFLETMRRAPQLPGAQQEVLREFLERCDLVKFARAHPAPDACRAVAQAARSFVEQTRGLPPANQSAGAE